MKRGTWKQTRRPHRRSIAVALAIGFVAVSSGCLGVVHPPGRFTGALPRPLDEMTNREFALFVAQLRWNDATDTTRRCDTTGAAGAPCRGGRPSVTTRARILSEWTAHRVGGRESPPNGAVVWKLRNLGGRNQNM
jgi:hypothetical protein